VVQLGGALEPRAVPRPPGRRSSVSFKVRRTEQAPLDPRAQPLDAPPPDGVLCRSGSIHPGVGSGRGRRHRFAAHSTDGRVRLIAYAHRRPVTRSASDSSPCHGCVTFWALRHADEFAGRADARRPLAYRGGQRSGPNSRQMNRTEPGLLQLLRRVARRRRGRQARHSPRA
jgi:hypothetical protein